MPARILLVDDEPDFVQSMERGLVMHGFQQILATSDPRHALALIRNEQAIDVALIDLTMPEISASLRR